MKKLSYVLFCLLSLQVSAQVNRKILVEEFTGTWCGYCPEGHYILDGIETSNPNKIVPVGMHYNDIFEIPYSLAMSTNLAVAAYPRAAVDRFTYSGGNAFVMSRGYWVGAVAARLNVSSPVSININRTFNTSTRILDITVDYTFAAAVNDETRLTVLLVEDNLSSSQSNYMNTTTGSPFFGLGNPIPNYLQKDVARELLSSDDWGDANHPTTVAAGASYTKTFSFNVPSTWNENNVKIVAFINKKIGTAPVASTGTEILNAERSSIIGSTSATVENQAPVSEMKASPNPFKDLTSVSFRLDQSSLVNAYVTDMTGKVVAPLIHEERNAGNHEIFWGGTTEDFVKVPAGIYFIHIESKGYRNSLRVVLLND